MTQPDDNNELAAERDRLQAEVMRLRVERETGVPASMLSHAMTEEQARAQAAEALAWKAEGRSAPPTAAAAYSVGQYSRNQLPYLGPAGVMEAWRAGRLEQAGAAPPPPRNNGEHHHGP